MFLGELLHGKQFANISQTQLQPLYEKLLSGQNFIGELEARNKEWSLLLVSAFGDTDFQ